MKKSIDKKQIFDSLEVDIVLHLDSMIARGETKDTDVIKLVNIMTSGLYSNDTEKAKCKLFTNLVSMSIAYVQPTI